MFISLDIETTGLQKDRDEIIEIGAARYDIEGNQIDTYQTFVKPNAPLPKLITHITGIKQEDVDTAPPISAVADAVRDYMGDDPIIGHNISFDTEFLAEKGIVLTGDHYDTLPLSGILLPGLPTYSLEMLTKRFNITHTEKHRALDDAVATADLFFMLKKKINEIDNKTLERIQDVVSRSQWPLKSLFLEAKSAPETKTPAASITVPSTTRLPFNEQEIISLYEEGGPLSKCEKQYEKRAPQIEMTRKIVECFTNKTNLLAEAGTGTGKSIAYLLPAAFKAREEKTKVIIATHTKHLQDQLYNKDVPIAQKTIAHYLKEDEETRAFKATVLKGRKNYLSGKRLELFMEKPFLQDHEATMILKVLLWRKKTVTGDVEELALRGKEYYAWNEVCCDSAKCPHTDNEYASKCYLTRARERANNSDIIITNHALLLSDTTGPSTILPEYNYLIIDEAHHLEHEATSALSIILTAELMHKPLRKLRDLLKPYHDYIEEIDTLKHKVEIFFGLLGIFYEKLGNYQNSIRNLTLHDQFFTSLEWKKVHESAENITLLGEQLYRKLHAFTEEHENEKRAAMVALELNDLDDIIKKIKLIVLERGISDTGRKILWIYQKYDGNLGIKAAPLLVSGHLQETLFNDKASIVLTSATLTIEKRFDYIRNQLGLDDRFEEALLPSHFSYPEQVRIILYKDLSQPSSPEYFKESCEKIYETVVENQGKTLVLFTSKRAIEATYLELMPRLKEHDIAIYAQNISGGRNKIIELFKRNPEQSVIFGTSSFWEGIDIKGASLDCVMIQKLPFDPPDDPIHSSRSQLYANSFYQYQIPRAILRFKQGFGRLIRSAHDSGKVVILDSRVMHKQYGRMFINSIPEGIDITIL